jgi:hypothetical protein
VTNAGAVTRPDGTTPISGNGTFTGTGALRTGGDTTFADVTTINMPAGTVDLDGADAFGNTVTVNANTTINLSGSATMLVRSRRSRKTQMCLSVKAAGGGGPARFSVRGATGKARGFAATGTGPPISFAKGTGRTSTIALVPRKGKARGLSRTCRSHSRVLDGKKLKSKSKSKSRKR